MRTQCISDLKRFETFRNCSFLRKFWLFRNFYCVDARHANDGKYSLNHHFQHCAHSVYQIDSVLKLFEIAVSFGNFGFTKFQLPWFAPCYLWGTLFKSSFPTLGTRCVLHLHCFQTYRNCSLLCKFGIFRNFYSGDAQEANHGKHGLNHHFEHCAHRVYQIYSVLKLFEIAVSFANYWLSEISTPLIRTMLPILYVVQIIISDIEHTYYIYSVLKLFENFSLFCAFCILRNFYSADAHHPNYGTHSLNNHFQHSGHCVYEIFSIFIVFEIAVCFAHVGSYQFSTPLIRTMLTMVNVVHISISDVENTVYIKFTVFSNFSKLQFVLDVLAFSKFLLRWCAAC